MRGNWQENDNIVTLRKSGKFHVLDPKYLENVHSDIPVYIFLDSAWKTEQYNVHGKIRTIKLKVLNRTDEKDMIHNVWLVDYYCISGFR